jgi:hypothetical protein
MGLCAALARAGVGALLLISVGGCGSPRVARAPEGSISALVRASDYGLEVAETSREQARQEILETPTSFDVQFEDDRNSWDRARFFLENYIGLPAGHSSVVTRVVGSRWSLASNPAQAAYAYEVAKDTTRTGFTYSVSCSPGAGGTLSEAALNAANLARFIRDGKLEMSLLAAPASY